MSKPQPWDMLSHSRMDIFKQLRETYQARNQRNFGSRQQDGDRVGLLGDDSDSPSDNRPTPLWVEVNRQTDDIMNDVDDRLRELKKVMTTAAMPTFDDIVEEEQTVEIQAGAIQKRLAEANQLIRLVSKPERGETESEAKARMNVCTALAARLQTQSHALRRLQMDFLKRLKGTQDTKNDLFRDDPSVVQEEYDMGLTEAQMREVLNRESLVDEREREINQITQSIVALAEMFRELQTLVIDQGTILDRIDYNIEMAVAHTEEGVKELVQAEKSQRKARNKLCIMFLIVVAVALVLALSFKPKSRSGGGTGE